MINAVHREIGIASPANIDAAIHDKVKVSFHNIGYGRRYKPVHAVVDVMVSRETNNAIRRETRRLIRSSDDQA